jgi:hypothetical protein
MVGSTLLKSSMNSMDTLDGSAFIEHLCDAEEQQFQRSNLLEVNLGLSGPRIH